MRFLAAFSLSVLLAGAGIPAGSVEQAKAFYYEGIYGDRSAAAKSDQLFTALYKQNQSDPLVSVYFGSLRLLEAEHTWALWRKNSLSKQGIRLMDGAVQKAPENLEVRFVRAATELHLPPFFGRQKQAEEELSFLASAAADAASRGSLEPKLAAASLLYYGNVCQQHSRTSEATNAWNRAIALVPDSHAGKAAAAQLAKRGA